MYILIIKIFIIGIFTFIGTSISKKYESHPYILVIMPTIFACFGLLGTYLFDVIEETYYEPKLEIKTVMSKNEINFNIKIKSGSIASVIIDYPVGGTITNFQDLNSLTDAHTTVVRAIGATSPYSQNNIEFRIEDIEPNTDLQYKIFYMPFLENIFIAGTDRYKISYIWEYKGNKFYETQWRLTHSDQLTEEPSLKVKGFQVIPNRVLSPDEIRKMYEEGIKKRSMDR